MKKTVIFVLQCLLLFLHSCDLSYRDAEMQGEKIIGNYYLSNINAYNKCVIQDYTRGRIIGYEVVAWNNDSIFIIAKQKPYRQITDSIYNSPNPDYMKVEKIYKEHKLYYYWIINTREEVECYSDTVNIKLIYTKGVYGPYSYEEYWEKRRELNVPDSLKLMARKEVKHFKLLNDIFCKPEYIVVE